MYLTNAAPLGLLLARRCRLGGLGGRSCRSRPGGASRAPPVRVWEVWSGACTGSLGSVRPFVPSAGHGELRRDSIVVAPPPGAMTQTSAAAIGTAAIGAAAMSSDSSLAAVVTLGHTPCPSEPKGDFAGTRACSSPSAMRPRGGGRGFSPGRVRARHDWAQAQDSALAGSRRRGMRQPYRQRRKSPPPPPQSPPLAREHLRV